MRKNATLEPGAKSTPCKRLFFGKIVPAKPDIDISVIELITRYLSVHRNSNPDAPKLR